MKKVFIGVLAALMLFAFVACDNNASVKVPTGMTLAVSRTAYLEGEDFDPSVMEACMVQEQDGLDKEKVLQVFMKGYKLHGKVVRAAKVMVGKPKSN